MDDDVAFNNHMIELFKQVLLYFSGMMYSVRFMSPVISFLLGAYFLTFYATFEGKFIY